MKQAIEDVFIAISNDEAQIQSPDESSKHIQMEQEEIGNEEIVNSANQLSDALGYPDITTMVTKIDKVHHRLLALGPDLSQEEIRIAKQSAQHHEDVVTELRHIIRMPILRAVRETQFIKAYVSDSTNRLTDRAVTRVLSGGNVRSIALRHLLSKKNFKSTLILKIEHEITEDGRFPYTDPNTLNKKIAKSVDVALGRALRTYAQNKYEKQFRRKYEAALRKSMEGFETGLKNSGL
ncbi:hypothetical protein KCU98_g7281, partial [Aureobasidium melanogenum]